MKKYAILSLLLVIIIISGCDQEEHTPTEEHDHEETHEQEEMSNHHDHHDKSIETELEMNLKTDITPDEVGGWNVKIETENFRFAPESVNKEHIDGEGHGHIYVNGEKLNRVYSEWYHIPSLPLGTHEIRVTLNANTHEEYEKEGKILEEITLVQVTEVSLGHSH